MTAAAAAVDELVRRVGGLDITQVQGVSTGATTEGASTSSSTSIDWEGTARALQACADSLRTAEARVALGNDDRVVQSTARVLQMCLDGRHPSPTRHDDGAGMLASQTQAARVVGNLVNDSPANRTRCLDNGILRLLVETLRQQQASTLTSQDTVQPLSNEGRAQLQAIKASTGALLNLVIDTPNIQKALSQSPLPDLLSRSLPLYRVAQWGSMQTSTHDSSTSASPWTDAQLRATTVEWTAKLLAQLSSDEKASLPASTASQLLQTILSLHASLSSSSDSTTVPYEQRVNLLETELSLLITCTEILESRAQDDTALQDALIDSSPLLLPDILVFVESASVPPPWLPIAEQSARDIPDELEVEKTFTTIKTSVARIVMGILGSDKAAALAYGERKDSAGDVLGILYKWIEEGKPEMLIVASTSLANLTRKDAHCVALLQKYPQLLSHLRQALITYSQPASAMPDLARPGEAIQVLHGVTGLLKNLSIPGQNKQILLEAVLLTPLATLLKAEMDVASSVQNNAIGCIKHLCGGSITAALLVITGDDIARGISARGLTMSEAMSPITNGMTDSAAPLSAIIALVQRSSDPRLRMEGTRIVTNLIRTLYSSRSLSSPVTPTAVNGLEVGILRSKACRTLEASQPLVSLVSEMLRTGEKYPVLVNEAIVALTLLSTTENGAATTLGAISQVHESSSTPFSPTTPAGAASGGQLSMSDQLNQAIAASSSNNGGANSLSYSRTTSLNPRHALPRAVDVVLKWLNEYAIESAIIPVELATNAFSLVDGILSNAPHAKATLPMPEIRTVLQGIVNRNASGATQQALQTAAQLTLRKVD